MCVFPISESIYSWFACFDVREILEITGQKKEKKKEILSPQVPLGRKVSGCADVILDITQPQLAYYRGCRCGLLLLLFLFALLCVFFCWQRSKVIIRQC